MDITEQSLKIQEAYKNWASEDGGKAFVCSDLKHLWEQARVSVVAPRALIVYNGEELRGAFSVAAALGRVDRQWLVAIVRGRGMSADRGDSLNKVVGNAKPFYQLVQEARDICRSMLGVSVESPVDFRSIRPMNLGDQIVDGYLIAFSLVADLPFLVTTPVDNQVQVVGFTDGDTLFQSIPCVPDSLPFQSVLPCVNQPDVVTTMQGVEGVTYDVTFNMASLLEGKAYTGGTIVEGRVIKDATPPGLPDEQNEYKLIVSDPAATYYLNNAVTTPNVYITQQQFTIPIKTGATVTLVGDSIPPYREGVNFNQLTISGYAGILPNEGQWVQLDVLTYQAT